MERLSYKALFGLLFLSAVPVASADDAATRQLVEQGRFWEEREQPTRAIEAWQRVVQADAGNTEALGRLAVLYADTGDRANAQKYLDKLTAVAPNSPSLAEARRAVAAGPVKGDSLARARTLASEKKYEASVAAYREAFQGKGPPSSAALEYYQTLGATADGWGPARDGLAELARSHPEDPKYTLAYAEHLTYRESTRREGIDKLAALSQDSAVATEARPAWRQALLWMQMQPGDMERYRKYLSVVGSDAEVQDHLQGLHTTREVRAVTPEGSHTREIFTYIQNDQFDAAQAEINTDLKRNPHDADAHGALGILRMRQGNFEEATSELRQAEADSPRTAGRWSSALRAAAFWGHIQNAQAARKNGDNATAYREFDAAFSNEPPDVPDGVRSAYADSLIERKRDVAAEPIERGILRRSPDNPDALRGLITILARNGQEDEALRLANGAPPDVQMQLSGVRAEQLRSRANAERKAGLLPQAQADLEQAMLLDPNSPWIRLDLAAVLRAEGHSDQADTLLSGLAASNGDLPQVRMTQAYAAGNEGDWEKVLLILEQIKPEQRPPDAYVLQRRAWINYQMQRVKASVTLHQPAEGYAIMNQAALSAGTDPELLAAVAGGWAQLGDTARAVGTMRQAIQRSPHPDAGMRVQYAALLLTANQDGEFEVVADDIATHGNLTADQQKTFDSLVVGYRIKLADRARTNGKLGEAYVEMRDVIARYPNDPRVQLALARLLAASGDLDQSAAIYKAQMADGQQVPQAQDDDVRLGLINTRLAASDNEGARTLIKAGLHEHPEDPRYWQASARLAEAENRRGDALEDYRHAEALTTHSDEVAPENPPQLAWIDPTQPNQYLPLPVANAVSAVGPSTGPLRPRASSVALPPPQSAMTASAAGQQQGASGREPVAWLSFALGLGAAQPNAWIAIPPPAPALVNLRSESRMESATGHTAAGETVVGDAGLAGQTNPDGSPTLASQIDRLEAQTSGWAGGAMAVRTREGQKGLGQLTDIEVPLEWASTETRAGRLKLDVTPVYLTAGRASGADELYYGSVATTATDGQVTNAGVQAIPDPNLSSPTDSAGGAAIDVGYQYGPLTADIGTTPLGFIEERLVGGLKLALNPGNWRILLDASRRAVTESLLSYAGEKDPVTGLKFGGVTRSGGRGDVTYDRGKFGLYADLGFYTLDGRNVDNNTEITGGAGIYVKPINTDTQTFTYGLNLTAFGYDKNLSYFTVGQGGYFSPQIFVALTVPIEWNGNRGNFMYDVKGALGVQSFHRDGNSLYPGNGALTQDLQNKIDVEPTLLIPTGYAADSNTGLAYSFSALGEYRLMPNLHIGGDFGVDNAHNYREFTISAYLRYYFHGQTAVQPRTPNPIQPFYYLQGQ